MPLTINMEPPPTRNTEIHKPKKKVYPLLKVFFCLQYALFLNLSLLSLADAAGSGFFLQPKGIQFIQISFQGGRDSPVYPISYQTYKCIIQSLNSEIHDTVITTHKLLKNSLPPVGDSHHACFFLLTGPGQNVGSLVRGNVLFFPRILLKAVVLLINPSLFVCF